MAELLHKFFTIFFAIVMIVTVTLSVALPGAARASGEMSLLKGIRFTPLSEAGDYFFEVAALPDDGIILLGRIWSRGAGRADTWIMRLDSSGDPLWQREFGGPEDDFARAIAALPNGGAIVVGHTNPFSWHENEFRAWVLRFDAEGHLLWERSYGERSTEATSVTLLPHGDVLVAGWTWSSNGVFQVNAWVRRIDTAGNLLWTRTFDRNMTSAYAIEALPDGGAIVCGSNYPDGVWALRLNASGKLQWERTFASKFKPREWIESASAIDLSVLSDGGVVLVGSDNTENYGVDPFVLRLNAEGNLLWRRSLGGKKRSYIHGATVLPDGTILVLATKLDTNDRLGWLLRLDTEGNILWDRTYSEIRYANAIATLPGNRVIVVGEKTVFWMQEGIKTSSGVKEAKDAHYWLVRGHKSYESGNHNEAIQYLERSVNLDSRSSKAYAWLGMAYVANGNEHKALDAFKMVIKIDPTRWYEHYQIGRISLRFGRYREAVESLLLALQHHPDPDASKFKSSKTGLIYQTLGDAYAKLGETEKARMAYLAIMGRYDNPSFLNKGKWAANMDKNYEEAVENYQRFLIVNPDHPEANYEIGFALSALNHRDKALPYFQKAVQGDPDNFEYSYALSSSYYMSGKHHEAMKFTELLDQDTIAAQLLVGRSYIDRGESLRAIKHMGVELFECLRQKQASDLASEAVYREKAGDYRGARLLLEQAVELDPESPSYNWHFLAQMSYKEKHYSEAAAARDRMMALKRTGAKAEDYGWAGFINLLIADYRKAIKYLDEGSRAHPSDSIIYEWFVVAAYGEGDLEAAGKAWRRRRPDVSGNYLRWGSYRRDIIDIIYRGFSYLAERAEKEKMLYAAFAHYNNTLRAVNDSTGYISRKWITETRTFLMGKLVAIYQRLPAKPVLSVRAGRLARAAEQAIDANDLGKAEQLYREVLAIDPWWPDGYYNLALVLESNYGVCGMARAKLHTYLEIDPQGRFAEQSRRKLEIWNDLIQAAESKGAQFPEDLPFVITPDIEY